MVGFIAGLAPQEEEWNTGAIISGGKGERTNEVKKSADITISKSPADIGKTLHEKLNG